MGILDIVLLVCFIPAIVQGITRGFVQQVVSLVSIIAGIWIAARFSGIASNWLSQYFTIDPKFLNVITFTIIVILVVLLLYWIGELLTRVIKITTLGWLNSGLGVVLSVAKTILILGLLILLFESVNAKFNLIKPGKLEDAAIYCMLRDLANVIFPYLKNLVSGLPYA